MAKKNAAMQRLRDWRTETAIVLGSGLNEVVPNAASDAIISYAQFDQIPLPRVPGHGGKVLQTGLPI